MRKIIIRVAIAAVILLAGIGVFQWHNYQQKVEYRKEALLYFKEEDYSKTISYLGQALKLQSVFAGKQNNAYLFLSTDLREKIQVEPLRDLARDSGQHKLTYKNQSLTKRK